MPLPDKPTIDALWATSGDRTQPSLAKREVGWVDEKPPFQYFNWFQHLVYLWQIFFDRRMWQSNTFLITSAGTTSVDERASLYLMDATNGAQTLTLPSATDNDGLELVVKKIDATRNGVTISGTVDGFANPLLKHQNESIVLVAKNGSWYYIRPKADPYSLNWEAFAVDYTDFATAALTNNITLLSVPAKTMIHVAVVKHSTSFQGGSISAYDLKLGVSGDSDKYMFPFDVFQAPGDDTKGLYGNRDVDSFSGSTNIIMTAESAGANLDQATQGQAEVWVLKSLLP